MTKTFLLTLGLAAALPGVMIAGTAIAGDDPPVAKTTAAPAEDDASAAAADPPPAAPEVTDKAALADDILAVIALPLVADDAREAGVDAAEIVEAIDAVDASGGSPADASAVIAAEAQATRARGPKKGFGLWVRAHVADGKRGEELASLIAKEKAEYAEMSDEDRVEVDAKLAAMHDTWVEHRKLLNERRRELVAKGKKAVRKGKAELATLEQKIAKSDARKKRLAETIATDPARKAAWEKMLTKAEKRVEKLEEIAERTEAKVDGAEARLDAAEDRKEDRKEKRDEKREEIRSKIDEKKADRKAEGKGG